jgi:hypothetical protein
MSGMPEIPKEFVERRERRDPPRKPREELGLGLHIVIRVIQLTIIALLWFFLR